MNKDQAEFINEMSEILVGYREGREDHLLEVARELVETKKNFQRQEGVTEIYDAIHSLNALVFDIEA